MSAQGHKLKVGIVGVSGYSGMELAKLLARHPQFVVTVATSDKWAGRTLGDKLPIKVGAEVKIVSQAAGLEQFGDVELLFLCTPPEASIDIAPKALAAGARVVDLSGGFRLAAADYPTWYGFTHSNPGLLSEAVYSMPEATGVTPQLRSARLVSNPGCYPTASALAVLPLLRAGLIEADSIIIDAKSGTTGAGRKGSEELSFSEVGEDLRAYRVLRHQHNPEIERVLGLAGVPGARVVFTPHLLSVRRGILATAYGRLTAAGKNGDATALAEEALRGFVANRPFLRLVGIEEVTLHAAVNTNRVVMGTRADGGRGIVIVCAAIDNLIKGAAGQALQNANLMFGIDETAGLE